MKINVWWIILIVVASIIVGFFLCGWYLSYRIKKILGIKSLKELEKQMKQAKKMEKRMKKGNLNDMLNDPQIRKQMEELKKKFGGKV